MDRVLRELTAVEFKNLIDELITDIMDDMKIPEYDRDTDIETYHIGEGGEFICMIIFRGEAVASVIVWRNQVIATMYKSDNDTEVLN